MVVENKNWCGVREFLGRRFRRWAEALDPTPKRPYRRLSLVHVVDVKKQEKIARRQAKYREPMDVEVVAAAYGRKRCVLRTLELMQAEYRDYFDFEESRDEHGNIIVRSTLKVRKDD